MSELCILFFGLGLCIGMWVTNWTWRMKIRDRARLGIRIEVSGELYHVVPHRRYDPQRHSDMYP